MAERFSEIIRRLVGIDPQKDPDGFDRRAFLFGATLAGTGLVLPRKFISVPKPIIKHVIRLRYNADQKRLEYGGLINEGYLIRDNDSIQIKYDANRNLWVPLSGTLTLNEKDPDAHYLRTKIA